MGDIECQHQELSPEGHEELLSIYNHTIEDIERAKHWQWKFAYYALIVQWAIYAAFVQYVKQPPPCRLYDIIGLKFILGVIIVAIASASLYLIYRSQISLKKFSGRMDCCREYFNEPLRDLINKTPTD